MFALQHTEYNWLKIVHIGNRANPLTTRPHPGRQGLTLPRPLAQRHKWSQMVLSDRGLSIYAAISAGWISRVSFFFHKRTFLKSHRDKSGSLESRPHTPTSRQTSAARKCTACTFFQLTDVPNGLSFAQAFEYVLIGGPFRIMCKFTTFCLLFAWFSCCNAQTAGEVSAIIDGQQIQLTSEVQLRLIATAGRLVTGCSKTALRPKIENARKKSYLHFTFVEPRTFNIPNERSFSTAERQVNEMVKQMVVPLPLASSGAWLESTANRWNCSQFDSNVTYEIEQILKVANIPSPTGKPSDIVILHFGKDILLSQTDAQKLKSDVIEIMKTANYNSESGWGPTSRHGSRSDEDVSEITHHYRKLVSRGNYVLVVWAQPQKVQALRGELITRETIIELEKPGAWMCNLDEEARLIRLGKFDGAMRVRLDQFARQIAAQSP